MKIILGILVISLLSIISQNQVAPPVWPPHFRQSFVESYNISKTKISGEMWYDADRKMSRLDRRSGEFQQICHSLMPNVTTPCTQLVRDQKRYVIFPDKRQCCFCCDAAHGCGILKRDWLKPAKYLGKQSLLGQQFDKWSIPDGDDVDYFWATTDQKQIPRKMDEGGQMIKDFIMNTYSVEGIPDNVFSLPYYCASGGNCPQASVCGRFRGDQESND